MTMAKVSHILLSNQLDFPNAFMDDRFWQCSGLAKVHAGLHRGGILLNRRWYICFVCQAGTMLQTPYSHRH